MNKIARLISSLYELSEPLEYDDYGLMTFTNYVIVFNKDGRVYPADANGNVLHWGELDGSCRGGTSHEEALAGLGYRAETKAQQPELDENE